MKMEEPRPYEIKIRNKSFAPNLRDEGIYLCPMPAPPTASQGINWRENLKPYERLFYHQTLASVRQCKRFAPNPKIPRDSLDYRMQAIYKHSRDTFPERVDFVLQKETCSHGVDTFRVLRNTQTIVIVPPRALGHPLKIGGIKEKISPHSLKLINCGPHSQFVNNGFSRQPADGNFFRY